MIELIDSYKYDNLDIEQLESWLCDVCLSENKVLGELGLKLVSDNDLLKANIEFLNHDYYTDIITFDNGYRNIVTGELWISIDRVKFNAIENCTSVVDELNRVIVHGVLHLVGYGDAIDVEKVVMRDKEDTYLRMLNVSRGTYGSKKG